MTKRQILKINQYFIKRSMKLIQICLLTDVITIQYKNGKYQKYSLNNFR